MPLPPSRPAPALSGQFPICHFLDKASPPPCPEIQIPFWLHHLPFPEVLLFPQMLCNSYSKCSSTSPALKPPLLTKEPEKASSAGELSRHPARTAGEQGLDPNTAPAASPASPSPVHPCFQARQPQPPFSSTSCQPCTEVSPPAPRPHVPPAHSPTALLPLAPWDRLPSHSLPSYSLLSRFPLILPAKS